MKTSKKKSVFKQGVGYLKIEFQVPTALCINKSNVDLLTKGNLSHYEMLTQVEQKFREWSPATFLGYSSINFDDEVIRKEFFKSLRKPYLTNTEGKCSS
jgi:exodeoxyribonuclease-1